MYLSDSCFDTNLCNDVLTSIVASALTLFIGIALSLEHLHKVSIGIKFCRNIFCDLSIYIYTNEQCALPVTTIMALLWQLVNLGTRCTCVCKIVIIRQGLMQKLVLHYSIFTLFANKMYKTRMPITRHRQTTHSSLLDEKWTLTLYMQNLPQNSVITVFPIICWTFRPFIRIISVQAIQVAQ